jgi:hypothetical protein
MIPIDHIAKKRAAVMGMPPDVHIPIGARTKDAVIKFIGTTQNIATIPADQAFIVLPYDCPVLNNKLPLWKIKESDILHFPKQIWVHVDYKSYRPAYIKAFPDENLQDLVLDHVLNRRVARLKGFNYLRIIPVTKGVNTSSGGVTEKYGFGHHNTERMQEINLKEQAQIEYADIADLVKMLNLKTGGKFQDAVRDAIDWLTEE